MKVQGKRIKMSRFVNDIALLANAEREREKAFNVTKTDFKNYDMKINIGKIKVTACRTN